MKKVIRVLSIILLVSVMLVSFTGCKELDEMRANQGFWQKDGSILLRGEEYIILPECEQLTPEWEDSYIYITEPDVPVLLSQTLGDWVDISTNGYFLLATYENGGVDLSVYCRKDKYDEMKGYIENGIKTDVYCYEYTLYNEENWDVEYKKYILTDVETDAINKVINEVEPELNSGSIYWDADYSVSVESRSADFNFCSEIYDIVVYENKFFIAIDNGKEDLNVYTVPKELNEIFNNIVAEYENSQDDFLME